MTDLRECLPSGFPVEAVAEGGKYNRTYWACVDPFVVTSEITKYDEPIARNLAAHRAGRKPITDALSRVLHDANEHGCRIVSVMLGEPFRDQLNWSDARMWYPVRVLFDGADLPPQVDRPFRLSPLANNVQCPLAPSMMLGIAQNLLAVKNYADGFKAYEYRWQTEHGQQMWKNWPMPMWDGKQTGRVLIWQEQGYGDTFMFCRYLPFLQEGIRADFLCAPEVSKLMKSLLHFRGRILTEPDMETAYDFHLPLCSLPMALEMTDRPIIINTRRGRSSTPGRYLTADADRIWRFQCDSLGLGWKVGICWAGRSTHVNNSGRTVTIETILRHIPRGSHVCNLQMGEASAQFEKLPIPDYYKTDLTKRIKDWSDTAKIIHSLDLIVTVHTAVAHLAGAMGKPVKLILAGSDDWRWKNGQVWYPSVEIVK